jgi:hypothetical protein
MKIVGSRVRRFYGAKRHIPGTIVAIYPITHPTRTSRRHTSALVRWDEGRASRCWLSTLVEIPCDLQEPGPWERAELPIAQGYPYGENRAVQRALGHIDKAIMDLEDAHAQIAAESPGDQYAIYGALQFLRGLARKSRIRLVLERKSP